MNICTGILVHEILVDWRSRDKWSYLQEETIYIIGCDFLFAFGHQKRCPFSILPAFMYGGLMRSVFWRHVASVRFFISATRRTAFRDRAHETRVCTHISAATRGGLRPVLHRWSSGRVLTSNMRPVQRLYRSSAASTSSVRVSLARVCLHPSRHPRSIFGVTVSSPCPPMREYMGNTFKGHVNPSSCGQMWNASRAVALLQTYL